MFFGIENDLEDSGKWWYYKYGEDKIIFTGSILSRSAPAFINSLLECSFFMPFLEQTKKQKEKNKAEGFVCSEGKDTHIIVYYQDCFSSQ